MSNEGISDEAIWSVHAAFASTKYGQILSDTIRYARYNLAGLSNHQWVQLLGADVNNLTHMPLTYGCARSFARFQEELAPGILPPHEASTLELAAIVHDQAEAIVTDIPYSLKTAADEAEEKRVALSYISEFAPGIDQSTQSLVHDVFEEVVFDQTSQLGTLFNEIERYGYMRTALRASRELLRASDPKVQEGLRWLLADVLSVQPQALIARTEHSPVAKLFLGANQDVISDAYRWPEPADFANYGHLASKKQLAFEVAKASWFDYTTA